MKVPICDRCWIKQHPTQTPVRENFPRRLTCAYCGEATFSGIRVDDEPENVAYPPSD